LAGHRVRTSIATLWRFFARHRIIRKKTAYAGGQDRPPIAQQRWVWFQSQLDLDPERLVFIDETWASTAMAGADVANRSAPAVRQMIEAPFTSVQSPPPQSAGRTIQGFLNAHERLLDPRSAHQARQRRLRWRLTENRCCDHSKNSANFIHYLCTESMYPRPEQMVLR